MPGNRVLAKHGSPMTNLSRATVAANCIGRIIVVPQNLASSIPTNMAEGNGIRLTAESFVAPKALVSYLSAVSGECVK